MTSRVTIASVEVNFHLGDDSLTDRQEEVIRAHSFSLIGRPDAIGGNWLSLRYDDLVAVNNHAEGDANILLAMLEEGDDE